MRIVLYIITFLTIALNMTSAHDMALGGLSFYGNDRNISERTSYNVFNKMQYLPKDSLRIAFEISLYGSYSIGHILTCKNDNEEIFNLIVTQDLTKSDSIYFNLNISRTGQKLVIPIHRSLIEKGIWHTVHLSLDTEDRAASLSIDDVSISSKSEAKQFFKKNEKVKFVFGVCDHYLDLFPFAIRNLQYSADKKEYFFPLDESSGNVAHTSKGQALGTVNNPFWLYQTHFNWTKTGEFPEKEIAAVYLDSSENHIYIYTSTRTYIYDISTDKLQFQENLFKNRFRFIKGGGENYQYIEKTGDLILFNNLKITGARETVVKYNFKKDSLTNVSSSDLGSRYHHNSAFMDKECRNIYQFGGYGKMQYHNCFHVMNLEDFTWKPTSFSGDPIEPRFYSSVGIDYSGENEDVYIYGGYGNETGRQDDGGKYFHDLYKINLKDNSISEVFNFNPEKRDMVPCRDLIMRPEEHEFYTLCYSQYKPESNLVLYKFNWSDGTCEAVSDSIPFLSQKISTQAHLFESRKSNCLICVLQEFTTPESSNIKIYRLSTPLAGNSLYTKTEENQSSRILFLYAGMIVLGVFVIILAGKKRSKGIATEENKTTETVPTEENTEEIQTYSNRFFLLGDFTAFDRNGKDITYLFSSKLRQLFLLIFFHTFRSTSHGISSNEISSIIWPEKDLSKSKNIRGVTIKNLRDALSDIDGIDLVNASGKWFFEIDWSVCSCDYMDILGADLTDISGYEKIRPYVRLLRRGSILKSENFDWLDIFKSEFEESILQSYGEVMNDAFGNSDYMVSYKISQVLLLADPLNEDLMKVEINSLVGLGDPVKARMKFRQFSLNFYEAYGKSIQYEDYISVH